MAPGYRFLVEALRSHLETGKRPVIPAYLAPMWQAFLSLSRARRHHAAGPEALSAGEIEAWARLNRVPMEPRHIALMEALDTAWLAHVAAPTKDAVPLTEELFDASFS